MSTMFTLSVQTLLMEIRYGYRRYAGGHQPRRVDPTPANSGFSPPAVVSQLTLTDQSLRASSLPGWHSSAAKPDVLNNDVHAFLLRFLLSSTASAT